MIREWVQFVIGAWILLSPWVLGASGDPLMLWSTALAGLAIILFNVWAIFGREEQARAGGREMKEQKK
jgi:hypothetical protein